jgi:peptidoglycan-associated lipoprotein
MKTQYVLLVILFASITLVNCQNKKPVVEKKYSLNSVYFDYDRSHVRSDATSTLQGNAGYLKQNSGTVTVEGHCDNRGTNEYNLALGQRRADSTKTYLVNLGVSSSSLRTVSYGEEKPVCHEGNDSCWQRNRRADFRK